MVRQAHVQQDRIRRITGCQIEAIVGSMRHQTVVTQLMGQVVENLGESHFIFDHQDAAPLERCLVTVVVKYRHRRIHRHGCRNGLRNDRKHRGIRL